MSVPMADQVAEVAREVSLRGRVYPHWIKAGRLSQEDADRQLANLRAALATLEFVARHATGLRALVHFLIATGADADPSRVTTATREDIAALKSHPAVAAVIDAFPDAYITHVSPAPMSGGSEAGTGDLFDE